MHDWENCLLRQQKQEDCPTNVSIHLPQTRRRRRLSSDALIEKKNEDG